VLAPEPEALLAPVFDSYALGGRSPVLLRYDETASILTATKSSIACVVMMGDNQAREGAITALMPHFEGATVKVVSDRSGAVDVWVLH
jgi:hypothetical protein